MFEVGILSKNESLELIEGEIFEKTISESDFIKTQQIAEALAKSFGQQAIVKVNESICLHKYFQLTPDISVLRPCADYYEGRLPHASDAFFVVELTETNYNYDISINPRSRHYGFSQFPEVWFVNPIIGLIEVCTKPNHGYSHIRTYQRGKTVQSETVPHLSVEVDRIFGENF